MLVAILQLFVLEMRQRDYEAHYKLNSYVM